MKIHAPVAALALAALALPVNATVIASGSAQFTLLEGKADSISAFNAYFGASKTRAQVLGDAAPGNAPFTRLGNTITLSDTIRPNGVVPTPYPGTPGETRSPQITNLDFDPADILGTWGASTDSFGIFAELGESGEQIAFTNMQRWTGPFTGSLLYGDFALRYVPSRAGTVELDGVLSGFVLTSNIDFLNSSWADLANASIAFNGATGILSINGDLLISGALNVLDPSAAIGTKFGTFQMTAAVPEPSTWALLGGGLLVLAVIRWRPVLSQASRRRGHA